MKIKVSDDENQRGNPSRQLADTQAGQYMVHWASKFVCKAQLLDQHDNLWTPLTGSYIIVRRERHGSHRIPDQHQDSPGLHQRLPDLLRARDVH